MDQYSITRCAANPTVDEGLLFARYFDEAAAGFFRFLIGSRSAEFVGIYSHPCS